MADIELARLTATEAGAKIASGAISIEQYARACLDQIEAKNEKIKAFAHMDRENALAQARILDKQWAEGGSLGPLHGVPVAIKDIIDTADYPTELGSPLSAGRRPQRDATVVAKLRAAGAIIIGKTVTTELAYYHPGPTRNPLDPSRTPGGSSSGSAAAVAADMVPLALGSQTNGSTIRPGAFCGVFAIKPSHGLISRSGVLTLSPKLDHVGAFARSLADLALILDVIAGPDAADPDTRPFAAPSFRDVQKQRGPAPRLAFVRTPVWHKADADTRAALEQLVKALGPAVVEIDLGESFAGAWDVHRTIMATDMAHHLAPFVARGEPSAAMRELLAHGRSVKALSYLDALAKADRYSARLGEILAEHDAIITPATTSVAPKGLSSTGDPAFCTLWTLTGLPSLSLPLLQGEDCLPLGVQLVGAAGQDAPLLRTAAALISIVGELNVRDTTHPAG
ncbi:MAG TPA: amidase [Xanthobacteraceae bacterium]|jgi:Asp-tRNA(Asn)/Glu-tRNA(Gln) amidotransferase A subunit family amidase